MTASTPQPRRRFDLAAPLPPTPDTHTRWERLAVGFGVWVLPMVNTVLLLVVILLLLR